MNRQQLQSQLFPSGIPQLWCPPLTFFSQPQRPDAAAIERHLTRLSLHLRGLLVPGSTGEGWEMSDQVIAELLEIVLPIAHRLKMHVLIGILKTNTDEVLAALDTLSNYLSHAACVGITLCAQRGSTLTQDQLYSGLARVLNTDVPTALYQLPQVTQNELEPETVERLFAEYSNIILFKDTSGQDRVANAGIDTAEVFMVRGAERGGYTGWLKSDGGNYDGFLLSSANVYAAELAELISASRSSDSARAEQLSQEIAWVISSAFEVVSGCSIGNPFTNANKCIEHLQHWGQQYAQVAPPLLYSGVRLPIEYLHALANAHPNLCQFKPVHLQRLFPG